MATLNTYAHMMPIDEGRGRLVFDSALGPKPAESILRTSESKQMMNMQVSAPRLPR